MPKRRRKSKATEPPQTYAELRAVWYARLRAEGFVDIEGGRDLNQCNGQTFRQAPKPGAENEHHLLWDFTKMEAEGDQNIDGWDGGGIGDHPRYEYYRRISDYAYALFDSDRRKRVIILLIDNSMTKVAKMLDMDMTDVRTIWHETLEAVNLPAQQWSRDKHRDNAATPPPAPGPVRVLSRAEIVALQGKLTPPKLIKDKP